jgi:hypothetical protein
MSIVPVFDAIDAREFSLAEIMLAGAGDMSELHPRFHLPPLMNVVAKSVPTRDVDRSRITECSTSLLSSARALINAGADPQQQAPSSCTFEAIASMTVVELDEQDGSPITRPLWDDNGDAFYEEVDSSYVINLPFAGRSALSACLALKTKMCSPYVARPYFNEAVYELGHESAWRESEEVLDELIKLFKAALHAKRPAAKVAVHEGVLSMWEAYRAHSASHDARLVCRGGETVSAHAQMLSLASPALAAMLASPLIEGATKSIAIDDCAPRSATFFLDLLYTGSSEMELDSASSSDATTVLEALALAHRWQVVAYQPRAAVASPRDAH